MPSDRKVEIPATASRLLHQGMVWDLVSETFDYLGQELTREFISHPGAVAVIAINEREEILLLEQYRRPVGKFLLEVPAGLLDEPGESRLDCAKRELLEEASMVANHWDELITFYTTPGGSTEDITVFIAKDIREVSSNYEPTGEEKDMPKHWIAVKEAAEMVLQSKIMSPSAVVGILAYALRNGINGAN